MRWLVEKVRYFFSHADLLLLLLCLITSTFGIIMVASASAWMNYPRIVIIQVVATILGVFVFILFSSIDIDIIAERRELLFIFNFLLIGLLFTPLAVEVYGNKSWLHFPFLPFNIQPSEICKITFIILLAKTMSVHQQNVSKITNVLIYLFQLGFIFVFIVVASGDAGSALMYILIFVVMLWAGKVNFVYFLFGIAAAIVGVPILWNFELNGKPLIENYQKNRILMIFDPSIDPNGSGIRWQTKNSLLTLTNGGAVGQGLFNGSRTQTGQLSQQHTDFIFSVIGEELGIIGCIFVLLILLAIILRCVHVGVRSGNYMNRLICIGIAAMLTWQVIINVGMCLGVTPVIGLTLPFLSYGGSSIISTYAAMGIVSGIYMNPAPDNEAHYIRPPY